MDFSCIDWTKDKLKDRDFLLATLKHCLDITKKALADTKITPDDRAVFISKSIGTVVSTAYAKEYSVNAVQLCFSPLEMIGEFAEEKGAVLFCADTDPFADYDAVSKIAKEKDLEMHTIKGGNHSLETGDIFTDIANLADMMKCVEDHFAE